MQHPRFDLLELARQRLGGLGATPRQQAQRDHAQRERQGVTDHTEIAPVTFAGFPKE
jgi:hypothetical protein